jgi:DNA replication protein DnaC
MGYPKEILAQSREALAARREKAAAARILRRAQVAERAPEALLLEREIASTSARLANAILSGEDVSSRVEEIRRFNLKAQEKLRALLIASGFEPDALELRSFCPLCGDSGVAGGQVCDVCGSCAKRSCTSGWALQRPSIPAASTASTWRYYSDAPGGSPPVSPRAVMAKTLSECVRYAKTFSAASQSLLLTGGPGLGKTHLSLSIAYSVIERGFDVLYVPFLTLLSRLESARFGKGSEEYLDYLLAPLSCELLILDDLGSEFATSFSTSVLYDLVHSRQGSRGFTRHQHHSGEELSPA